MYTRLTHLTGGGLCDGVHDLHARAAQLLRLRCAGGGTGLHPAGRQRGRGAVCMHVCRRASRCYCMSLRRGQGARACLWAAGQLHSCPLPGQLLLHSAQRTEHPSPWWPWTQASPARTLAAGDCVCVAAGTGHAARGERALRLPALAQVSTGTKAMVQQSVRSLTCALPACPLSSARTDAIPTAAWCMFSSAHLLSKPSVVCGAARFPVHERCVFHFCAGLPGPVRCTTATTRSCRGRWSERRPPLARGLPVSSRGGV